MNKTNNVDMTHSIKLILQNNARQRSRSLRQQQKDKSECSSYFMHVLKVATDLSIAVRAQNHQYQATL
jgi:hypothetical protein